MQLNAKRIGITRDLNRDKTDTLTTPRNTDVLYTSYTLPMFNEIYRIYMVYILMCMVYIDYISSDIFDVSYASFDVKSNQISVLTVLVFLVGANSLET